MTEVPLVHPLKDRLIAFGQGRLAPEDAETIEQHLESCHSCCETLLDLKDDTFIALLRESESPSAKVQVTAQSSGHAATIAPSTPSNPNTADDSAVALENHPRYRMIELVGQGGMGKVYKAEHRLMNRSVAIKLINSQLIQNGQAVERFRREVQAAARLSHPNIVTAYDAEQAGGAHFLVMEFVKGVDLATIVGNRGPLPVIEACDFVRQAAEGLQHAHEQGMVHRDIKPHNLMLADTGQVRILDFGLAGIASEAVADVASVRTNEHPGTESVGPGHLTAMGSVMGTPDYMAPEQAADAHSADIRADIYSLGCTLHFLLMGKPPFEADSVLTKLKAHAEQPPSSLTLLRKDVPLELSKIAARMMAKNLNERFQTPAEVANALAPFAKSASIPPKPRRRTLIAAAMLGTAALLAWLIYVELDKGQFIVETADDQVAVMVGDQGLKVRDLVADREYRLKPGTQRVRTGEYEIDVTELPAGLEVKTTKFALTRGGVARVSISFKPKHVTNTAEPDEQRLQGKWVAVTGHARKQPIPADQLAQLSIAFDGDLATFDQPGVSSGPQRGTFKINANTNPKQITLIAPDQRETVPGIFEFDDERLKLALIDEDYARPTNFDPDDRPDHITLVLERVPLAETLNDEERQVLKAAESFLAVMDEGRFGELFNISSMLAKKQASRAQVSQTYQQIRDTAGKIEQRTLQRVRLIEDFLGLPPGRYAAVLYRSNFEKYKGLWESVVLNVDDDGQWRANTYAATVQPLPLPEAKPVAAEKSQRPTSPSPSAGVPTSANLLTDPSFENTAVTLLPRGWSAWLDDGPDFRCEVVEGGKTGKHCLKIAGKGTRGVVFANVIPVDRSKRYALKGWTKFEGDKDARAIIKFNYFKDNQFLGVHDLVGVMAADWQRIEKTDALDRYPEANKLYAMCHVEGNGSGWFDDLELIAYEREKLPIDFDSRHGRNNRLSGLQSLDRWLGVWETEYVFRETDNGPETKRTMNSSVEQTLGDYFVMSHAVADASSKPSSAASATMDHERIQFLTFDQNIGAFRQWFFSSNGKTFEWRGQWDNVDKSLELRMLPDASRMTSIERFVDADHIQATLKQQFVMATKDAGRWSATRKAGTAKVDVPVVKTHAAEPAELELLNKFVGEWTIREAAKPSVWIANGHEKTSTEKVAWLLGGKFLMAREFDDQNRLITIWLATWEPLEKSYHFWFFSSEGWSGQWRVTWDSASRGFHWRSIDMPTGWIGTGFNRWVNDDTFDSQSLIKDENGRVLLDSTEDKRRKK